MSSITKTNINDLPNEIITVEVCNKLKNNDLNKFKRLSKKYNKLVNETIDTAKYTFSRTNQLTWKKERITLYPRHCISPENITKEAKSFFKQSKSKTNNKLTLFFAE